MKRVELAIDVFSVCCFYNFNQKFVIEYFINNTVISNSDSVCEIAS